MTTTTIKNTIAKLRDRREVVTRQQSAIVAKLDQHRPGWLAGDPQAITEYDAAVAEDVRLKAVHEELGLAIEEANVDLEKADHAEKCHEFAKANAAILKLLSQSAAAARKIDAAFEEIVTMIAVRDELRKEAHRLVPKEYATEFRAGLTSIAREHDVLCNFQGSMKNTDLTGFGAHSDARTANAARRLAEALDAFRESRR